MIAAPMDAFVLVLDREQWARGTREPSENSRSISLLNHQKRMCCLGYMCAQSGAKPDDLDGLAEPWEVANGTSDFHQTIVPGFLLRDHRTTYCGDGNLFKGSDLAEECQGINDDDDTSDETKIAQLNALLNPVGWHVVLVDTPLERDALGGLPVRFAGFVAASNKPAPPLPPLSGVIG